MYSPLLSSSHEYACLLLLPSRSRQAIKAPSSLSASLPPRTHSPSPPQPRRAVRYGATETQGGRNPDLSQPNHPAQKQAPTKKVRSSRVGEPRKWYSSLFFPSLLAPLTFLGKVTTEREERRRKRGEESRRARTRNIRE